MEVLDAKARNDMQSSCIRRVRSWLQSLNYRDLTRKSAKRNQIRRFRGPRLHGVEQQSRAVPGWTARNAQRQGNNSNRLTSIFTQNIPTSTLQSKKVHESTWQNPLLWRRKTYATITQSWGGKIPVVPTSQRHGSQEGSKFVLDVRNVCGWDCSAQRRFRRNPYRRVRRSLPVAPARRRAIHVVAKHKDVVKAKTGAARADGESVGDVEEKTRGVILAG